MAGILTCEFTRLQLRDSAGFSPDFPRSAQTFALGHHAKIHYSFAIITIHHFRAGVKWFGCHPSAIAS